MNDEETWKGRHVSITLGIALIGFEALRSLTLGSQRLRP